MTGFSLDIGNWKYAVFAVVGAVTAGMVAFVGYALLMSLKYLLALV